jgi:hypothetical protein
MPAGRIQRWIRLLLQADLSRSDPSSWTCELGPGLLAVVVYSENSHRGNGSRDARLCSLRRARDCRSVERGSSASRYRHGRGHLWPGHRVGMAGTCGYGAGRIGRTTGGNRQRFSHTDLSKRYPVFRRDSQPRALVRHIRRLGGDRLADSSIKKLVTVGRLGVARLVFCIRSFAGVHQAVWWQTQETVQSANREAGALDQPATFFGRFLKRQLRPRTAAADPGSGRWRRPRRRHRTTTASSTSPPLPLGADAAGLASYWPDSKACFNAFSSSTLRWCAPVGSPLRAKIPPANAKMYGISKTLRFVTRVPPSLAAKL